MEKERLYRQDGYQKGFDEARRTGGKIRRIYLDNYMKTETKNLSTIYSMEFIKGWYEGFTDGVAELMSKLVKKDDFWRDHIYEVVKY